MSSNNIPTLTTNVSSSQLSIPPTNTTTNHNNNNTSNSNNNVQIGGVSSSFFNSLSSYPFEDIRNAPSALKPTSGNANSASNKNSSSFNKYQRKVQLKIKGRTFYEIPPFPTVVSTNTNATMEESTTTLQLKSPKSKKTAITGNRPPSASANEKKEGLNQTVIAPEPFSFESTKTLYEHYVIYLIINPTTGTVDLNSMLIEKQDFSFDKEFIVNIETINDLAFYECFDFNVFIARRIYENAAANDKLRNAKNTSKTNNAKSTTTIGSKRETGISGGTGSNTNQKKNNGGFHANMTKEELIELLKSEILNQFGHSTEILHSMKIPISQMIIGERYSVGKFDFEQIPTDKYLTTNTTENNEEKTTYLNGVIENINPFLSGYSNNEKSEFLKQFYVRYELVDGTILSDELQSKLNPILINISSLKDLPNESYLAERCKTVSVSFQIRGKVFKTNSYDHATNILVNYQKILYLGPNSDLELYRDFYSRNPLTFEVHDRDPKEGITKYYGKADMSLKTIIFESRGKELSENLQIHSVNISQEEYEKMVRKEEEKRKFSEEEGSKTSRQKKTATSNNRSINTTKTRTEVVEELIPSVATPITYPQIFEGKYVERKSSIKIQLKLSVPFPSFQENEKSIYPMIIKFAWTDITLIQKLEQLMLIFANKPTASNKSKSRNDLFANSKSVASPTVTPNHNFLSLEVPELPSDNIALLAPNTGSKLKPQTDLTKYFTGFEMCDGKRRIIVLEIMSKEAAVFMKMQLEKFINTCYHDEKATIIHDLSYFYSTRLYEPMTNAAPSAPTSSNNKKEEKSPSSTRSQTNSVITDSNETKKPLLRVRLQDTLENILGSKDIYIKNKKSEDQRIITALSKIFSILTVDEMSSVMENGLLPDTYLLHNIKEKYGDDSLIEIDNLVADDYKRQLLEKEQSRREDDELIRMKMAEKTLKMMECLDDFQYQLGLDVGVEGIPLFENPPYLPVPEKCILEGEEKRTRSRIRGYKQNVAMFGGLYTIEEISRPERKIWMYIPNLKGHILLAFPPTAKQYPPYNVKVFVTGMVLKTDDSSPPPKLRAYTPFSPDYSKRHTRPELHESPSVIYAILVSSWTQKAVATVDCKLEGKLKHSFNKAMSPTRNFREENLNHVKELSDKSTTMKFQEELLKSVKKFVQVPTYPEERKQLEKSLELRSRPYSEHSPKWVSTKGRSSSSFGNTKPPEINRLEEVNIYEIHSHHNSFILREDKKNINNDKPKWTFFGKSSNKITNELDSARMEEINRPYNPYEHQFRDFIDPTEKPRWQSFWNHTASTSPPLGSSINQQSQPITTKPRSKSFSTNSNNNLSQQLKLPKIK
ncbi:hypothetical protein ABK040_011315 [Willaertia magna]